MVKPDVVAQKIAQARKRLRAADEIFGRSLEDLLPDEPAFLAAIADAAGR